MDRASHTTRLSLQSLSLRIELRGRGIGRFEIVIFLLLLNSSKNFPNSFYFDWISLNFILKLTLIHFLSLVVVDHVNWLVLVIMLLLKLFEFLIVMETACCWAVEVGVAEYWLGYD